MGLGGRPSDEARPLLETVERLGAVRGDFSLVAHLKTGDEAAISRSVEIFREYGLLARVFFQTYWVGHVRFLDGLQTRMGVVDPSERAKFVYMGWPTDEAMELMQRPENRRSRLGIPAILARSRKVLAYLRGRYPEVGLHANLTYDRKLISAVAGGVLAVDSVMVADYNWLDSYAGVAGEI